MANRTCSIDGCARPASKRGWCGMHYLRWYKHGDAAYEPPHHTRCRVADCGNAPRSGRADLCEMHYYRIRRRGVAVLITTPLRADVKYRAAHARVEAQCGKAADYSCIDCGRPAQHWSYDHGDPDEKCSPGGQPYSLDTSHYEPRCAACHAAFDGTGWNQFTGPQPARRMEREPLTCGNATIKIVSTETVSL